MLGRLAPDLERWGGLFIEVARTRDLQTVDQVLGGLVERMSNDLIEGWLRLPIPVFDTLNEQSEELLRACRAYLGHVRDAPGPLVEEERRIREAAIGAVLHCVGAFVALKAGPQPTEMSDG